MRVFFSAYYLASFYAEIRLNVCYFSSSSRTTHSYIALKRRPLIAITRFTHSSSEQQRTGGGGELANVKSPISRQDSIQFAPHIYLCMAQSKYAIETPI